MPKITLIIPNFNHARFLEQRIQTALSQTYTDFEALFLDDASTDDSRAVFAKYADDPRVRCVFNTVNSGGPFPQWNRGVREAQGEYIWIAEADDYAAPTLLETLAAELDANPSVGLAYCQSWIVDERDHVLQNASETVRHLDKERWTRGFVNHGADECRRFLVHQNTIPNASAVLFRRSVYEQTGWADESLRLCGDWMLWIKMLLRSDVAFAAEPLNFFRRHSGSVTHSAARTGLYAEERYRVLRELCKEVDVPADVLESVCDSCARLWLSALFSKRAPTVWRRKAALLRSGRVVDPNLTQRLWRNAPMCLVQNAAAAGRHSWRSRPCPR